MATTNIEDGKTQILNDISKLQNMELEYYYQLQQGINNRSLSEPNKQAIASKINEISMMRINLYETLKKLYGFYNTNIASTNVTMLPSIVYSVVRMPSI